MRRALLLGISIFLVSSLSSPHLEHTHPKVFKTRFAPEGEALYRAEKLVRFTKALHRWHKRVSTTCSILPFRVTIALEPSSRALSVVRYIPERRT